jgi:hypothetical protein
VQDGVGFVWVLLQRLDRLGSGKHKQFYFAALSLALHFFHDRHCARSGADHEPAAFPGIFSFTDTRRVSKGVAKFFGRDALDSSA